MNPHPAPGAPALVLATFKALSSGCWYAVSRWAPPEVKELPSHGGVRTKRCFRCQAM
jgi:hypothetical protein